MYTHVHVCVCISMGVQSLWSLLEICGERVNVESLSGKVVAVDASIWIQQFVKAMRDERTGEMMRHAHLIGFFRRICRLIFHNIRPVFVFDGATPSIKRHTTAARRRRLEGVRSSVKKAAEKLLLNYVKTAQVEHMASKEELMLAETNDRDDERANNARRRKENDGGEEEAMQQGMMMMMMAGTAAQCQLDGEVEIDCEDAAERMRRRRIDKGKAKVVVDGEDPGLQVGSTSGAAANHAHRVPSLESDALLAAQIAAIDSSRHSEASNANGASADAAKGDLDVDTEALAAVLMQDIRTSNRRGDTHFELAEPYADDDANDDDGGGGGGGDSQHGMEEMNTELNLTATEIANLDPEAMSMLPTSLQLELMDKLREQQQAENREVFTTLAHHHDFSKVQIQKFLKMSQFRKKVDSIQQGTSGVELRNLGATGDGGLSTSGRYGALHNNAIQGRSGVGGRMGPNHLPGNDGLIAQRIAADPRRDYIFTSSLPESLPKEGILATSLHGDRDRGGWAHSQPLDATDAGDVVKEGEKGGLENNDAGVRVMGRSVLDDNDDTAAPKAAADDGDCIEIEVEWSGSDEANGDIEWDDDDDDVARPAQANVRRSGEYAAGSSASAQPEVAGDARGTSDQVPVRASDWRERMRARQQYFSMSHGFKFGRKLSDWDEDTVTHASVGDALRARRRRVENASSADAHDESGKGGGSVRTRPKDKAHGSREQQQHAPTRVGLVAATAREASKPLSSFITKDDRTHNRELPARGVALNPAVNLCLDGVHAQGTAPAEHVDAADTIPSAAAVDVPAYAESPHFEDKDEEDIEWELSDDDEESEPERQQRGHTRTENKTNAQTPIPNEDRDVDESHRLGKVGIPSKENGVPISERAVENVDTEEEGGRGQPDNGTQSAHMDARDANRASHPSAHVLHLTAGAHGNPKEEEKCVNTDVPKPSGSEPSPELESTQKDAAQIVASANLPRDDTNATILPTGVPAVANDKDPPKTTSSVVLVAEVSEHENGFRRDGDEQPNAIGARGAQGRNGETGLEKAAATLHSRVKDEKDIVNVDSVPLSQGNGHQREQQDEKMEAQQQQQEEEEEEAECATDVRRKVTFAQPVEHVAAGDANAQFSEFAQHMFDDDIDVQRRILSGEREEITTEIHRLRAFADTPTDAMYAEVQNLLALFGMPYYIAPNEAEAQCASMQLEGLVDGVVTEDNDVFLFGGRYVMRNLFEEKKFVEVYDMKTIESRLGLDREKLVLLAMMLGSDYTEGIRGVGVVNAMEILGAYGGTMEGLRKFKHFMESPDDELVRLLGKRLGSGGPEEDNNKSNDGGDNHDRSVAVRAFEEKHQIVRRNWQLPERFPSDAVMSAYMKPRVDSLVDPTPVAPSSDAAGGDASAAAAAASAPQEAPSLRKARKGVIAWAEPDIETLTVLCRAKFGWDDEKISTSLTMVRERHFQNREQRQATLDQFLQFRERFAKIRSKRIQEAVTAITGVRNEDIMLAQIDATPPKSTRKKTATTTKRKTSSKKKNVTSDAAATTDGDGASSGSAARKKSRKTATPATQRSKTKS